MRYETCESKTHPGEWLAEAINYEGDGEIHGTIFTGILAQERAEQYAEWMNSVASSPLQHQSRRRTSVVASE